MADTNDREAFYAARNDRAQQRTQQTRKKAQDALQTLLAEGYPISVAAVVKRAGIARSALYTDTNKDIGTDLNNDHPVGFVFVDGADAEIETQANIETAGAWAGAVSFGTGANEFWCSSCHDVHGITGVPTLLRATNAGSGLCLHCHIK